MNRKLNAIIVDDEKGCIANLHYMLLKLCPDIAVVGTGDTLEEALGMAAGHNLDVAFLDVELFSNNIFNALSVMKQINFKVVFVTAYQQYAFKAIKIEALDYILKPLSDSDILGCYCRIKKHFSSTSHHNEESNTAPGKDASKYMVLKNLDKVYRVKCEDVYYMSGHGAYTEITFQGSKGMLSITICKVLNKIAEEYESEFFLRVHKSYVINLSKIQHVVTTGGLHVQMTDRKIIPVAKRRAHYFMSSLNSL